MAPNEIALIDMLAESKNPITLAIKDFEEAKEKMSPDVLPLRDLDPALHRKGYERAV